MKPDTEIGAFEPAERPENPEPKTRNPEPVTGNSKLVTGNSPDPLPEFCHYHDNGCELASSCLNCPFPQCLYDQPRGRQHWLKKLRAREMAKLFASRGKDLKELADMFGVSRRTVQRALKIARAEKEPRNE
ncbi:MAG: helix-turn-helix domain-containing protein [Chloroflexi bacterium]|nr:helix-turn-helix domain-containing protein [Chloroflexota bacterium]